MSIATVNMVKYMAHRMEIEEDIKLSVQDMKIMLHNIALYEEIKLFTRCEKKNRPHTYLQTKYDIPKHILMFGVKNVA